MKPCSPNLGRRRLGARIWAQGRTAKMSFRRPLLYKTLIKVPLFLSKPFSSSSSSSSSSSGTISTEKLFHKDWLSPNEVIKIFGSAQPNSVLSLLHHVSTRKDFKPTESLYSVVITKLGEAKNFNAIHDILKIIKTQKNCTLTDCFFHNVIRVYGNAGGLVDRAIDTLFDMPSYDCWPSVKTFNFVLNLLVSSRRFDSINRVFVGASRLGVEVDACSLNILIKGLCKCGCLEDALQVLDEFPKQRCHPNKVTFATIMHCMCEKGMVNAAFELVERMESKGVSQDAVTFNILVSGLRKQGRIEEAMELLDRMRLKGCEPNKGTYQEVLYGLLKANRFVDARDFVQLMRSRRLIPSFWSYKMLIMGLCDENFVGDVEWALKSMVSVGFVPGMGVWRKVLENMFPRQNRPNISVIVEDLYG